MPSIAKDRKTAPFYVVMNSGKAIFVKEGDFFRSQGGLEESWGSTWVGVEAPTLGSARRFAASDIYHVELSHIHRGEV